MDNDSPSPPRAAPAPTRRGLLAAGAIAAGAALLDDVARAGESPTTQVADRTTTLKITALRALPAGAKCYVCLDTSHGVTGWGEVTGLEPAVAAALAQSLFELLDGENPTRIEHLWQKV